LLRNVADWDRFVNQPSFTDSVTVTPNGILAALWRLFLKDVNAGNVSDVVVAMRIDRNGKVVKRLDKYGVVIYKVAKKRRR
jgi:hypothetical protein